MGELIKLNELKNNELRIDIPSLEYPLFTVSKEKNTDSFLFELNLNGIKKSIKILPTEYGRPTIYDKDILVALCSLIIRKQENTSSFSREIEISINTLLKILKKSSGGRGYKLLKESLNRLSTVSIKTNIETNNSKVERVFNVLYYSITDKKTLNITISKWFFNSLLDMKILTLNSQYFLIKKPFEKRMYEIARKFCGSQPSFKIGLEILKEKFGSSDKSLKSFKQKIRKVTEDNNLPEYELIFDEEKEQVIFFSKKPKKALTDDSNNSDIQMTDITIKNAHKLIKEAKTGWDFKFLAEEFHELNKDKNLENVNGAFINFVKKKIKKEA